MRLLCAIGPKPPSDWERNNFPAWASWKPAHDTAVILPWKAAPWSPLQSLRAKDLHGIAAPALPGIAAPSASTLQPAAGGLHRSHTDRKANSFRLQSRS